ncbi:MAG: hypothetical protein LBO05_11385 [Deltaproteobacteria bacterium]|nr:hypothetical protein [Deltaproteobacteria bacterium]
MMEQGRDADEEDDKERRREAKILEAAYSSGRREKNQFFCPRPTSGASEFHWEFNRSQILVSPAGTCAAGKK